jgi:hypothetical protein
MTQKFSDAMTLMTPTNPAARTPSCRWKPVSRWVLFAHRGRLLVALLWILASATPQCAAHGGVSIEKDLCVLRLGAYLMHFTGYQPEQSGAQEFCEDIPAVGPAIVVLDAVDNALRDMPIELIILRDTQRLGNQAKFEELGGEPAIAAATVARVPAAIHPSGSLTLQYPFKEAGRYIGLVRAQPSVGGEVVAVFPFAVGTGGKQWRVYAAVIVGTVLLAAALFWLATRLRGAPA